MRSYQQYCGLAKALDVVGDRWTLLIVRELLFQDECRFTDLQHGLPGIATNLLTARLRDRLFSYGARQGAKTRHGRPRKLGRSASRARIATRRIPEPLADSPRAPSPERQRPP